MRAAVHEACRLPTLAVTWNRVAWFGHIWRNSHLTQIRLACLWNRRAGYLERCLTEVARASGSDVLYCYRSTDALAPYEDGEIEGVTARAVGDHPSSRSLQSWLESYDPNVVLVSSWSIPAYRKVARMWADTAVRILHMDNQFQGRPKQRLAVAVGQRALSRWYDAVFLPGERQRDYATRLGFTPSQIATGSYAADGARFSQADCSSHRSFLFCGRLLSEKGVDHLLAAYTRYRATVSDPWPLKIAGVGPLAEAASAARGVSLLGFLQPDELAAEMRRSGCFVLPSVFEPWGVVLHEAALVGLPLVASGACGAAVHLLQDGYNGVRIEPGDVSALADALRLISQSTPQVRKRMGEGSFGLSGQFGPALWASNLERLVERTLAADAGGPR
jgi:glycosyltransferase involved in cell wall biosynthesis